MRLICGLFHLDGSNASDNLLRSMALQLDVSRLRSSIRIWRDGPAGLSIIDFSRYDAPASALPESAGAVMAADVRLDKPLPLASTLSCAPQADDALLLALLEHAGPSVLSQVLGDFAFASWNKTSQRLICARDIFGIRPFAYVHQPKKLFAFASFPKALYGTGIVPKTIDEEALARRIVRIFRHDDCAIAGIQRLPPAHYLEISREGISLNRYWQPERLARRTKHSSPEPAARELHRLLDEAVNCRLSRTAETGSHLSGGLDSSAIAVTAARQLREKGRVLHAYSFIDQRRSDIALEDETEFVKAVVEQEKYIDWTPIFPPTALPALEGAMDLDNMIPLAEEQPENAICMRAEKQGVDIILSGWGGDEAASFNGTGAFAEMFLRGRWRQLAREIAALKHECGRSVLQIFRSEVLSYLLPAALTAFARSIRRRRKNDSRALFHRILSAHARHRLCESTAKQSDMGPFAYPDRWQLVTSPHIAARAEVWAQFGARHGLAFSFPLLDRRVVEFSLSLPADLFIRGGFRRRLFRDAMTDVLPAAVRLRHEKYLPFPARLLDLAERKTNLLAKIDGYAQNTCVCRMLDLPYLREQVEAFPSPERLREEMRGNKFPAVARFMIAAMQGLRAAAYLEQHAGPACAVPPITAK